ncbi:hypothetical protein NPIL_57321 [Nephila pilipes]|uniref:Uncharacterized protein n=1 Tax=Nephila pilipes TaxID=299642 RepID=A0A8X6PGD6_NEPPI|nr:hypothetical protein NPIL_57321 [Nephila pilipes]
MLRNKAYITSANNERAQCRLTNSKSEPLRLLPMGLFEKSKVWQTSPMNLQELKTAITTAVDTIDNEACSRVMGWIPTA